MSFGWGFSGQVTAVCALSLPKQTTQSEVTVDCTGLEPTRGVYNATYIDELENIVNLAAAHGVYVFLDMHQDGLSKLFCGEGFPSWAI